MRLTKSKRPWRNKTRDEVVVTPTKQQWGKTTGFRTVSHGDRVRALQAAIGREVRAVRAVTGCCG